MQDHDLNSVEGFFKTVDDVFSFVSFSSSAGFWCVAQSDISGKLVKFQANSEQTAAEFLAAKLKASIYFIKKGQ